ncbi:hypothetical protein [Methylocella silvestris]|uniref:hypothetical protein n=1 Tax=Methylocella silvestris TaxID=199596 RepID=UPI0011AEF3E1|nr:hypothetical protein [Methylocella silvestris]
MDTSTLTAANDSYEEIAYIAHSTTKAPAVAALSVLFVDRRKNAIAFQPPCECNTDADVTGPRAAILATIMALRLASDRGLTRLRIVVEESWFLNNVTDFASFIASGGRSGAKSASSKPASNFDLWLDLAAETVRFGGYDKIVWSKACNTADNRFRQCAKDAATDARLNALGAPPVAA